MIKEVGSTTPVERPAVALRAGQPPIAGAVVSTPRSSTWASSHGAGERPREALTAATMEALAEFRCLALRPSNPEMKGAWSRHVDGITRPHGAALLDQHGIACGPATTARSR